MKLRVLAPLVAALFSVSAHSSGFDVPISGTFESLCDPVVYPGICDSNADTCDITGTFSGFLKVSAPSEADGTYMTGSTLSLSFDKPLPITMADLYADSSDGYLAVITANGGVFNLNAGLGTDEWTISIFEGRFEAVNQQSHGRVLLNGRLALPGIPEPAPLAMMAAGLVYLGLRRRQAKIDAG